MHALLLLALLPSAEPDKDITKGLEKLQGVWKLTAMESRGQTQTGEAIRTPERYILVVVGDNYVLNTHAGTLALDQGKKAVDLKITEGRYMGQTVLGLLELTGDTLKLAFVAPTRAGERPREMKTGQDTLHLVYTFERDKAATKEQAEARLKELKEAVAAVRQAPFGRTTPANDRATQQLLRQVLEKLDRIEKRLDEMEKKGKEK